MKSTNQLSYCSYYSRGSGNDLIQALSAFRHSMDLPEKSPERPTSGSGWAWWRRKGPTADLRDESSHSQPISPPLHQTSSAPSAPLPASPSVPVAADGGNETTQYAKTLRLSSDQLARVWTLLFHAVVADAQKLLNLAPGPNTVQFSVTSSYSGMATCSARIFLWEDTDQVVISDIDGTITK